MRQFMSQQASACLCSGLVLVSAKYDAMSHGECMGLHSFSCVIVDMNPHAAEIVTESRLEELTGCSVQWTARRRQRSVDLRRDFSKRAAFINLTPLDADGRYGLWDIRSAG